MSKHAVLASAFFVLLAALTASSQTIPPFGQPTHIPGTTSNPNHKSAGQHQQPCYEVAGVSKAAIERRKSVQQNANSQVQAVCSNASLTPQQRNQEIRAIRQQERTEISSIITPQQQEAIRSCNQARHPGNGGGGGMHLAGGGGGHGPCGEPLTGVGGQHPYPSKPLPGTTGTGTTAPTGKQLTDDTEEQPEPEPHE